MAFEIERKFLVKGDAWRGLVEPGLVWEVDEYFGANAPLVTAEIELPDENAVVALPDWIDREVADDHRYKNNNLAMRPFAGWKGELETK